MAGDLFGTDGVRGTANTGHITAEIAMRIGMAAGHVFRTRAGEHRVVIGKDTRLSGYMLETALTAGFAAVGVSSFMLGPVPTPAVGMLTRSMRADLGVMISASHNPAIDNGIKIFGPDGYKLSDEIEAEIERLVLGGDIPLSAPDKIGRSSRLEDGRARYVEFVKGSLPRRVSFEGLKVVIDAANGAAYKVAPQVLWELGAEIIPIGVSPNGLNINKECGSTYPQAAARAVLEHGADIGITLDGDADRLIVVDDKGRVVDGDQLMALIALRARAEGKLANDTLVATVMSNLGLERYLENHGMGLLRTPVGDRNVVSAMRTGGFSIGGEQSGHIVLHDHVTTGDGLIAALQVIAAMVETGAKASELLWQFEPVPQRLMNVHFNAGADPLSADAVKAAIEAGQSRIGTKGRLLIRKSGTEPLIRVMGECEDERLMETVLGDIVAAVEKAAA
ncbi:MAG: phosphoglucosamine mutase [Pseudomonadota bacterium]